MNIDFLIITLICFLLASQCKAYRDLSKFRPNELLLPLFGNQDREYVPMDTWHIMDGLNNTLLAFPALYILFKFLFPDIHFYSLLIFPLAWFYYYQPFIWSYHVFFRKKQFKDIKHVLTGYNPKNWF